MRIITRGTDRAIPFTLDVYDIAYIAGGPWRVAETALLSLRERGLVTVRGIRVRAGALPGGHAVEEALLLLCPRSKQVTSVLTQVAAGAEVAGIGARLRAAGLVGRLRRRPTAAGRACLADARCAGACPSYVFDGWAGVEDRSLRRTLREASPVPTPLESSVYRMGEALDDPFGHDSGADTGFSHHSCGGGGGAGD